MVIEIPVNSAVKIWMVATFGPEPINISHQSKFRPLITPIQPGIDLKEDASIRLEINYRVPNRVFNESSCSKISRLLTFIFHQNLFTWCKAQIHTGNNLRDSIRNFLGMYQIPEDILSLDTAYRLCQSSGKIHVNKKYRVFDLNGQLINEYDSAEELAERLGISTTQAYKYINQPRAYGSKFILKVG